MAKSYDYKKPRKINVVTVSLAAAIGLAVYFTYQFLPVYLLRQESYRVLEEHSSKFASTSGRYLGVDTEMELLTGKMSTELRRTGVRDPNMEHWIDVKDENAVAFGVLYSEFVEWPFDAIEKTEFVSEIELLCTRVAPSRPWTCKATTADAGQK